VLIQKRRHWFIKYREPNCSFRRQLDKFEDQELAMMRLMITALAVIAVIAGAFTLLRSRTSVIELSVGTAAMPSLLELHAAAGVHKLPVQDIEDQSLIYPTAEKR
jgi:hypothetical protein